jgi:CheY-like chemotaxis protein
MATTHDEKRQATAMQVEDINLQTHAESGVVHVLVVDDDRAIRETLRLLLEEEGYLVSEASDGQRALEILRDSPQPHVVVLDFMMPRLDGAGVLRAVVADPLLANRHAFILVSANAHAIPRALMGLLATLKVPIMSKPLDLDDLLAIVEDGACRVVPGRGF